MTYIPIYGNKMNIFQDILEDIRELFYTSDQIANAKTIFSFWKQKGCTDTQAAAWVGNVDGECSLEIGPVGDHGEAYGLSQWHSDRINEIKKGTGIDVRTATLEQQLEAVYWEVTKGWYKTVWSKFIATTTLENAIAVLVQYYEQSGSQARDVARRTKLATYWMKLTPVPVEPPEPGKPHKKASKPLTTHIDHAGEFKVYQDDCPHSNKKVRLNVPRAGIIHTVQGGWSGGMSVFERHYAPHFILGVDQEDHSKVHIAQLVPIGYIGSALKAHNNLAIVQIEITGFCKTELWRPDETTCEALASLMVVCEKEFGIPLSHPWPDSDWGRAGDNPHRHSGKFGKVAGWFGHVDVPDNDHYDPGQLEWSYIFDLAKKLKGSIS